MKEASAPVPAKSQLPEETVPHPPATTPAPVAPKPLDIGGDGCEPAPVSGTDSAGSRNKSTTPVERLLPLSGGLPRRGREFLHHAGQILFYPWMEQVDRDRPAEWRIQRQWLGQVLQGALNIEQSKGVAGNELARFTGTRPLTIDTQRDHLQAAVVDPEVPEWLYRANNRIVPDGPGSGWTFFLDPCGKECTTDLPFLKGWCGRIHDTAKVLYMDCIHTRSGFPVYVRHYDNFYDLRDRVLMTLDGFNKLFPVGDQGDRVLIIDRAILGLESFPRIREKGWGVVTWEKGYAGDGWVEGGPTVVCTLVRKRNNSSDDRVYRFEFQESRWKRDPSVRRLIVRATNPEGRLIEVSVLCSSLLLAAAEAVLGIFSRWLQENDFRQLDLHFGFMAITSYRIEFYRDLVGILQDRPVESIEFRELRHRVAELRRAQEKELFGRERLLDALEKAETEAAPLAVELQRAATRLGAGIRQIESGETTEPGLVAKLENVLKGCKEQLRLLKRFGRSKPKLTEKLEKLEGSIAARKLELAGLEKQLETVVREDSRLRLLVEMGAVRPDTRAKAVMDAVKVTGRNLFACLLVEFRKHYDNRRDDAVILRLLTRAEGVLRFTGETLEVGLWIKGSLGETTRKAVAGFLAVISARINERCRGQFVAVEVKLLDGPPRS